ncbi:GIY-YIG nuclease family protein [Peterkaempfera bronchialis]|uniref:GIY-YIG nuclease family protein n=1 Tax=Peterkaempfera bronchialis TaxID=2126346 RepID=A0A345SXS5_9ACTN|nr:GIY-YIG nuclease family protein [Peterkaempfera bronchialis]
MTPRPLRLRPWLVRALIPPRLIGTYVLYTAGGSPTYVGRSDTDVRRRLLRHCTDRHGDYFTYDVHPTAVSAYDVECALFHLLAPEVSNRIHPDRPDFHPTPCAFCLPRQTRLHLQSSGRPEHLATDAS